MKGREKEVKTILKDPDVIEESEKDHTVCIYYKYINTRYYCVVVKHENGDGFIITAFPVDKIKKGKKIYEKTKIVS